MIDCFKVSCLLFVFVHYSYGSLFSNGAPDDANFQSYEQLQKVLEEGNKRSREIEKFTKEHTIRHNQRNAAIASASNVMTPLMTSSGMTASSTPEISFLNSNIQTDPTDDVLLPTLMPSIEPSVILTTRQPILKVPTSEVSITQNNEEFLDKMRIQSQIAHNAMMSNGPSFLPQQGQVLMLRDPSSLVPDVVAPPQPSEMMMNPILIARALSSSYPGIPPGFFEPQRTRISARPGRFDDDFRPRPQLPSRESRELL